jgi:hypothetical protein
LDVLPPMESGFMYPVLGLGSGYRASNMRFPLSSPVLPPKVFAFPFILPQDSFLDLLAYVDFVAGPRSIRLLQVLALGSFTVLDSAVADRLAARCHISLLTSRDCGRWILVPTAWDFVSAIGALPIGGSRPRP